MEVTDSDVPSQSADKECRLGDLHLASVMDKAVAGEHVQRWPSDMKDKIVRRTRKDSWASFVTNGGGPVLSARVAGEYGRILGQELTEAGERVHADLVKEAKSGEVEAWEQLEMGIGNGHLVKGSSGYAMRADVAGG